MTTTTDPTTSCAWLAIPKATVARPAAANTTACAGHPDELIRLLNKYPVPVGSRLEYGTAGFRYDADILPPVMVRVGIFCALYHKHFMVTASHNDESYNGVKLCNADGSMLTSSLEALLTELVNFTSTEQVLEWLHQQYSTMDKKSTDTTVVLHTGRDTRSHSPSLQNLAILAAQHTDHVAIINHGVVTTPMLHHVVLHAHAATQLPLLSLMIPLRPFLAGYYDILVQSYLALLQTAFGKQRRAPPSTSGSLLLHTHLLVDCACGVGYEHVLRLNAMIQDKFGIHVDSHHQDCEDSTEASLGMIRPRVLVATNGPDDGPLNEDCGSEHVQKQRALPKFYSSNNGTSSSSIPYACALDGDSDRIVFFSNDSSNNHGELILLDGDKISCLIAKFLQEQFSAVQQAVSGGIERPTLGVVQTAYANGASTQYLKTVLPSEENVLLAKTGVKHVHHKAVECCDVGVYFEANGHGTVVFGPKYFDFLYQAEQTLRATAASSSSAIADASVAIRRLQLLPSLINQAVGDALSDMLLVDVILTLNNWTLRDWNESMYTDLPSVQSKVQVPDRNVIVTNDTETRCVAPAELQVGLDQAMAEMNDPSARCFVRPSGTENVVRIYAEAGSLVGAQLLAQRALEVIQKVTAVGATQQSKM